MARAFSSDSIRSGVELQADSVATMAAVNKKRLPDFMIVISNSLRAT
jgi:hypothetical protein